MNILLRKSEIEYSNDEYVLKYIDDCGLWHLYFNGVYVDDNKSRKYIAEMNNLILAVEED